MQDVVYSVSYSFDGKRFASAGADKTVIIWTNKVSLDWRCRWKHYCVVTFSNSHCDLQAEGIVKYNHNDSVQVLAYNPLGQELASGTATDFGLWSPELKHVAKHKVCISHKLAKQLYCTSSIRTMLGDVDAAAENPT